MTGERLAAAKIRALVKDMDVEIETTKSNTELYLQTGCVEKDILPILQSLKIARMAANNVLLKYGDRSMSGGSHGN